MIEAAQKLESQLQQSLGKRLFGMEEVVHALTISLIGRGHLLLEGPPGLGKTLLSKNFAYALGGLFKRIQGTADLMPTDMTGVHVFNSQSGQFEFQQGPLFADVVLVDEINRAGPKTQSALLEAMEERQVTVDRDTFELADNFLVVATQNPREFEGTYPLPESQLDRFMLNVAVSYPAREHEEKILNSYNLPMASHARPSAETETIAASALSAAREEVEQVHLSADLVGYILDIAAATRSIGTVNLGLSSRGTLALARCARVEASLRGGEYVVPDDVKRVAPWVINHRIVLTPQAAIEGLSAAQLVDGILSSVAIPR